MKGSLLLAIVLLALACSETPSETVSTAQDTLVVKPVEVSDNHQYEYYPNGQVKMEGMLDDNGLKVGKWNAYFEDGRKLSSSTYYKGINHGYSIVWYPNGNVRYFGDYSDGKKVGTWTFYSEDGKTVKEESF